MTIIVGQSYKVVKREKVDLDKVIIAEPIKINLGDYKTISLEACIGKESGPFMQVKIDDRRLFTGDSYKNNIELLEAYTGTVSALSEGSEIEIYDLWSFRLNPSY
jgi:pseudouridine-5'-phosphate glycosidase